MTRQIILSLTITATSMFASSLAQAGCGSQGCQTRYGQYTARQAFILFQQHPEMIQRFPQVARELETQFGAIQPAATQLPAAIPAAAVSPAAAPLQIPVTSPSPAVIDQVPAATVTPNESAPIVTPNESIPLSDANVNPEAPPVDLPIQEPPVNL